MRSGDSFAQIKRRFVLWFRRIFFRIVFCRWLVKFWDRHSASLPLGKRGEIEAERFLLKQGYWLVERGFGEKVGEIDLIASDGQVVVFVEVKTRTSDVAGNPAEAVDLEKQRHITQTARLFSIKNQLENSSVRFDVIAIIWPNDQWPEITHLQNAFEATGEFQMF